MTILLVDNTFELDLTESVLYHTFKSPTIPNILTRARRLTAVAGTNLTSPVGLFPDHSFLHCRRMFYCGRGGLSLLVV